MYSSAWWPLPGPLGATGEPVGFTVVTWLGNACLRVILICVHHLEGALVCVRPLRVSCRLRATHGRT